MPRGIKRERNIPEEITSLSSQIAKHESVIKSLKAQLTSLQAEREQSELKQLNEYLKENGLTAKDLVDTVIKEKEEGIA